MSIVAIDPTTVRIQSKDKRQAPVGFDDVLQASNPAVTQAIANEQGYQPAAVANAAITGISTVPGTFSDQAPYYTSPLSGGWAPPTGGYNYSGVPSGVSPVAGYPGTASTNSLPGIPGVPSNDYLEKQALFQQMNDANWEMLVAQVTVNDLSRDWQARSNILKTKSDAEINSARNLRQ